MRAPVHEVAETSFTPRGPRSRLILDLLTGASSAPVELDPVDDPLGDDDLHLALYLCYELHYRGLPGIDDDSEWDPELIRFRHALEHPFLDALRGIHPPEAVRPAEVRDRLSTLAGEPDPGPLAAYLERDADVDHFREFVMHRSAYQLKEADPHSWGIPRLEDAAKTALMEIQYDEYGSGDHTWMHSALFGSTLRSLDLDDRYGAYLDRLPGTTLATVNLVSLFGLHRRWRGALLGHLAAFEMSSAIPNRAYGNGLRRLGYGGDATRFFDEHVQADSLHEVLAADLAAGFAAREPALAADVVFGAQALGTVEARFSDTLLDAWHRGATSLRPGPDGR